MHRNRLILFWTIGLSIFLSLPLLNITLRVVLDLDPIIPTKIEQFWSADSTEGALALKLWRCCDRSLRPGDTLVGKNGYLFLGNDHNSVIDKTTGRFQPAQETIETWIGNLENLANYVEKIDASFVFILAPNKHSIYPDYLPQSVIPAVETVTDRVLESAERHDLPVLDLRQPLRALRSEAQSYLLTDTHWTRSGAALAYTQTMSFINDISDFDLYPLNFEQTESHRPAGDLAAFLKVRPFLGPNHEKDYAPVYHTNSFCIGQWHLNAETAEPCKEEDSLAVDVRGNDRFLIRSQVDGAPNEETVVMICDSFCWANSELFNASFQTVYRIHRAQFQGELLKEWLSRIQPNIVVFQIVERAILEPALAFN
jgi:alginate O-acetyltransferase complex protein AlgJ